MSYIKKPLQEGDREYHCPNGRTYAGPANCCLFCNHVDILWDYTNGPYHLSCDIDKEYDFETRSCDGFEEDNEEVFFDDTADS